MPAFLRKREWDEGKKTYPHDPNPDFSGNFVIRALDKGIEKTDTIVLIRRSQRAARRPAGPAWL